ncbi:MAG: nucleotidyltransferase domain-containing protein [Candidatus Poribacteria bacterium]
MRRKRKIDSNLELFKERLQKKLGENLIRIILFGSRARGDNDEYSDYDCLVIVKENNKSIKEAVLDIEADILYEKDVVFSAFSYTEDELALRKYMPFIINVNKEGIAL